MVDKQDLDIGLVGDPVNGKSLSWRTLWASQLGVLLPTDHPLASMGRVPARALRKEPLMLLVPAPGWTVRSIAEEACRRAGFTPSKSIEVTDASTVFALVNAGVGGGFASAGAWGATAINLALRPLAEDYAVQTNFVWKSGTETPALKNLLGLAEDLVSGWSGQGAQGGMSKTTEPTLTADLSLNT